MGESNNTMYVGITYLLDGSAYISINIVKVDGSLLLLLLLFYLSTYMNIYIHQNVSILLDTSNDIQAQSGNVYM